MTLDRRSNDRDRQQLNVQSAGASGGRDHGEPSFDNGCVGYWCPACEQITPLATCASCGDDHSCPECGFCGNCNYVGT